jgi:hypothetical protein
MGFEQKGGEKITKKYRQKKKWREFPLSGS